MANIQISGQRNSDETFLGMGAKIFPHYFSSFYSQQYVSVLCACLHAPASFLFFRISLTSRIILISVIYNCLINLFVLSQ